MVLEPRHLITDVYLCLGRESVDEGTENPEARYLFEVVCGGGEVPFVGLLVPLAPRMGSEVDEGVPPFGARNKALMGGGAVVLPT